MTPISSPFSDSEASRPTKLSKRARWLAIVPLIAATLLMIGLVSQWVSHDLRISVLAHSLGMRGEAFAAEAAAFPAAFWPMLARTIPILIFTGTMFFLFRLFRRLSAGHVLDSVNARLVSRAGLGFVLFAATAMISNTVTTLLLSLYNPPGQRILTIGFTTSDIGAFAAGFALWGLGAVLVQAARLADDHASIV